MHQPSDRKVGHHKAIEFLPDKVRGPAAQQSLATPKVGLQLIESGLNFPALIVEGGQIFGWRQFRVEDGRDQAIELVFIRWLAWGRGSAIQRVFHHPDLQAHVL